MTLDVDMFPDRPGGELDFRGRNVWLVSAPDGKRVVEVTISARAAKAFEKHVLKDEAPGVGPGASGVESTGCSPPAPTSTPQDTPEELICEVCTVTAQPSGRCHHNLYVR